MKRIAMIGMLMICLAAGIHCTKDNTSDPSVNWAQELKGSAWAGTFQFQPGAIANTFDTQPFSVLFETDQAFTWFDIGGEHQGTWSVLGDQLKIFFTEYGYGVSATLTTSGWDNITNIDHNAFHILSIAKSSLPDPEKLIGSIWEGKDGQAKDIAILFATGQKILWKGSTLPYEIKGAGISFQPGPQLKLYGVFITGNRMTGIAQAGVVYYFWNAEKR